MAGAKKLRKHNKRLTKTLRRIHMAYASLMVCLLRMFARI